ncbi:DNA translocase FtsK 4TM domain-containing protein [Collinsella sp. zg1085]|uniref:FtsK/SpoIIIE family DNA translocase n=1 Tax=Collinsella sp. zg1085 TaxID=2844380 RepID=UPI001C0BDBC8|nr:DNA translocase FtsK 4TM domain-containing protein [Collinsella sp. zg1085]QWT16988.1 DNA translocase FtsK 4TM domain-containing protein [Collinsella sp. zg1085]
MAAASAKKNNNKKRSATTGSRSNQYTGAGLRARQTPSAKAPAAAPVEPLLDRGAYRDIAGVILGVLALACFLAVIAPSTAPITRAISEFFHLGFGLGAYVVPLVLLAGAALLFIPDSSLVGGRTALGGLLIFVAICTVLSLMVPGTDAITSPMFSAQNLSSSGGYLGASLASLLQSAFGKSIALVLVSGLILLGLVLLGFSIGGLIEAVRTRIQGIRHRPSIDVNEAPWGEETSESALLKAMPVRGAQSQLFEEPAGVTSFIGSRKTSVREHFAHTSEPDEDPLVTIDEATAQDVSPSLTSAESASTATTRLIPIENNYVNEENTDNAAPATQLLHDGPSSQIELSDVDSDAEPPLTYVSTKTSTNDTEPQTVLDALTGTQRPIPSFLKTHEVSSPASATQIASTQVAAAPHSDEAEAATEPMLPPMSMLRHNPQSKQTASSSKELEQTAANLESTLHEFGLKSAVVGWIAGPTVTTFKVQPGEGERVSRINSLEDDIALTLATDSVRIFAPIPGTSLVGIEIPNRTRQTVTFGDILPYVSGGPLEFALGRDAEGSPMVADLAKMPHLLIAGTTGSGKSVVISSIVMSLLMRTFPEDVRLIMIDPKRVEFAPYDGLPHLYVPVVTEPKQAASALQWAVSEMERRLKIFERIGVRKIATFNEKQAAGEFEHYDNPPNKMPYLVIVIDELSDLMMVAGKDVEASIVRIAQLGRAAGIHMIVATQRPSSNVVTGLIKANITNRIGLTVATGIDSRVILDQTGAEKLTGQGDMLFSRVDWGKPKRIQGCYVSDEEIVSVVDFIKEHSHVEYHEEILSQVTPATVAGKIDARDASDDDPLLWDAARIVVDSQLGSTSGLQRRLKVGYARAGRIMDMLEEKGIVGPPDGSKPREVLLDMEALQALEALETPLSEDELGGGY